MDIDEYDRRKQGIISLLVRAFISLFTMHKDQQLDELSWNVLLQIFFPQVEQARNELAELGREFYDSQRELHHPDLPRHDTYKANYQFSWFQNAMEPARIALSKPGANDNTVIQGAMRVAKEAENGGRRTILRAVQSDPIAKGWARVATGRETCAFCMMLVSRGPVYTSAENAGLNANDTSATQLWQQASAGDIPAKQAIDDMMTRWHPNCDCIVVPVFKRSDWPGLTAFNKASDAWAKNTKGYHGLDALNAFRRALNEGALDPRDFSIAA